MVLSKIAKILCKEDYLIRDRVKLVDALGIPGGRVAAVIKLYDLRHVSAYELMREILVEWVEIRGDSAAVGELRRILNQEDFNQFAGKSNLAKIIKRR